MCARVSASPLLPQCVDTVAPLDKKPLASRTMYENRINDCATAQIEIAIRKPDYANNRTGGYVLLFDDSLILALSCIITWPDQTPRDLFAREISSERNTDRKYDRNERARFDDHSVDTSPLNKCCRIFCCLASQYWCRVLQSVSVHG